MLENKKGELALIETLIFFVLNLIFFVGMIFFVYSSGGKSFVYEETYAKQIALMIDNARPGMVILMNVDELETVALKNNQKIDRIFSIDKNNDLVKVSLGDKGGYQYSYFSDYDVEFKINNQWLSIIIKDRGT